MVLALQDLLPLLDEGLQGMVVALICGQGGCWGGVVVQGEGREVEDLGQYVAIGRYIFFLTSVGGSHRGRPR